MKDMSDLEFLEISFYIFGDVISDSVYSQIMESLDEIDGIHILTHTYGTNTMYVSAKWKDFELDKKIEEIQKIANVKGINIYKKTKLITRSLIDDVKVSDKISWKLNKDTISEITRAKNARDYYKALSLSCTVFGYYGKQLLLLQSKKTKIAISKKTLKRLESIICLLYTQKIINKTVYSKINRVRKLRNIFQHEDRSFRYSSAQAQQAERVSIKALDCIKFIKTKYDSMISKEANKSTI
jgi:hypothetical protein